LPSSDCVIGPPPANGTVTKLTLRSCLSCSIDSDGVVPAPGEPTLYCPVLSEPESLQQDAVRRGEDLIRDQGRRLAELLAGPSELPGKDMKDLIDLFKKEPGKYSVGSPGAGRRHRCRSSSSSTISRSTSSPCRSPAAGR